MIQFTPLNTIEHYSIYFHCIIQYSEMEKSIYSRYADSQDHLIISLNQQIETLIPLKDSYASLQRYHIKLTQDFESLLTQQDHETHIYMTKIKELLTLNDELDVAKNRLVEDLREMENQKAKLTLERKNLMSACETLASKFNLESQQNLNLQDRTRELLDNIKKTEQNVGMYRKIIHQLETEVALKQRENSELEQEISRRKDKNKNLAQSADCLESSIKKVSAANESTKNDIKGLEVILSETERKVRDEVRKGRDLSERILGRKEELAKICHQKEYYSRLIESELLIKEDLDISEAKLNDLISRRSKQLTKINQENAELCSRIQNQEAQLTKNQSYRSALTVHLNELVQTNSQILQALEKCCSEDVGVHKMLNQKANRLQVSCSKVRNFGITNTASTFKVEEKEKRKAGVLRDRSNQNISKIAEKSGKSWINELKEFENRSGY